MKKITVALSSLSALALPFVVSAQTPSGSACANLKTGGLSGLSSCIILYFNYAVYLVMAAAVAYVVYGAFKLGQEESREDGKNIVLYGIIGLFVMISIWGLVNILVATFGISGQGPISPDTSAWSSYAK